MENCTTELLCREKYRRCDGHVVAFYLTTPAEGFQLYSYLLVVITSIVLSIVGTLANALVVASYVRNRNLRTSSNMLFIVLAASDLSVTAVVQPLYVAKTFIEISGTRSCLFLTVIKAKFYFCVGVSLLTIVLISVERWFTLAFPYRYQNILTPGHLKVVVVSSWLFQIVLTIWVFGPISISILSWLGNVEIAVSVSSVIAIWIWIHRLVRKHRGRIESLQTPNSDVKIFRATTTSYTIIAAVLVCYLPMFSVFLYFSFAPVNFITLFLISPWAEVVAFANSTLNPLILFWRKKTFRTAAREFFPFVARERNQMNRDGQGKTLESS